MTRRAIRFAPLAQRDIREMLRWSRGTFGGAAHARYQSLLETALSDITDDAERTGSVVRAEIDPALRSWHLRLSRGRAASAGGTVARPRHILFYRLDGADAVQVVRVLHENMEFVRHLK